MWALEKDGWHCLCFFAEERQSADFSDNKVLKLLISRCRMVLNEVRAASLDTVKGSGEVPMSRNKSKKGRKGNKLSIGLDVGSSSIKLVALIREGGGKRLRLWRYGIKMVPPEAGKLSESKLAGLIKELYEESKVDFKSVVAAIPGTSAVVRYIQMPRMAIDEAREALKYEAGQYIPFKTEEAQMDCHILNGSSTSKSDAMQLMLVATRKKEAESRMQLLHAAGLAPEIPSCLHLKPYSIWPASIR